MVRIACGPRNAKTVEHSEDEIQRGLERYAMALRYIDRFHASSSAQNRSDGFTVIVQWCPCSHFGRKGRVSSNEDRFGAANGRCIQQYTEVRSKAKSTRVSIAMSVTKNQIGCIFQAQEDLEKSGRLPEAEQAGNIREPDRTLAPQPFDFMHVGKGINDHACNGALSLAVEGQIRAGDPSNAWQAVYELHFRSEPKLNLRGFSRSHAPRVEALIFHCSKTMRLNICCQGSTAAALFGLRSMLTNDS